MTVAPLNSSLNAFRPDLADRRLEGKVEAERFVDGQIMRVRVPIAPLKRKPDPASGLDSQALLGELVRVFDQTEDGWAWVQLEQDGYVGYMPLGMLGPMAGENSGDPTHWVSAPRTFVYPGPDLKFPAATFLSLGAGLRLGESVETRGTIYRKCLNLPTPSGEHGWIVEQHVREKTDKADDYVALAQGLIGSPYLWGGKSSLGLDCSGLVQLALECCGMECLRDASMQETSLGEDLDISNGIPELQRGDFIFWPGHIGIMTDADTLLHANGHHMAVAEEPFKAACERIAANEYGTVSGVRRLAR